MRKTKGLDIGIYFGGAFSAGIFLFIGLKQCIYYKLDLIILFSISMLMIFCGTILLYLYNNKIKNSLYFASIIVVMLFIWCHLFNIYSEFKISPFPLIGIFMILIMNRLIADFKEKNIKLKQGVLSIISISLIISGYCYFIGPCFSHGQILKNQVVKHLKKRGVEENVKSILCYPDYTIVVFKDEEDIEYRYEFKNGRIVQRALNLSNQLSGYKNIENKEVRIINE
ncbi:hypothetical protein [Clostridium polynesiense]|uniref:hypothetical protein n=1 Tax=Clostridium polynesiense TaxID=1325933 RepID=UPI00058EB31F|nr:hypothetical protein [Clostridium polynesiense]